MNKKGFTMVVAFVFILIAGSFILILFFALSNLIVDGQQKALTVDALQRLDSIIASSEVTTDTTISVPVIKEKMNFRCDIANDIIFSQIEIGGYSQDTTHQLVVGRELETDELLLFTKELRLPYKISNILYVTSEEEALIIKRRNVPGHPMNAVAESFEASIPDKVNIIPQNTPPTNLVNYQQIRVVSFGTNADTLTSLFADTPRTREIVYIAVIERYPGSILEEGTVSYYKSDGNNILPDILPQHHEKFSYAGLPMLLGYVWQGEETEAKCYSNKIGSILRGQTKLQIERLNLLYDKYAGMGLAYESCATRMGTSLLDALHLDLVVAPTNIALRTIPGHSQAIESRNEALLRGVRCASIY